MINADKMLGRSFPIKKETKTQVHHTNPRGSGPHPEAAHQVAATQVDLTRGLRCYGWIGALRLTESVLVFQYFSRSGLRETYF